MKERDTSQTQSRSWEFSDMLLPIGWKKHVEWLRLCGLGDDSGLHVSLCRIGESRTNSDWPVYFAMQDPPTFFGFHGHVTFGIRSNPPSGNGRCKPFASTDDGPKDIPPQCISLAFFFLLSSYNVSCALWTRKVKMSLQRHMNLFVISSSRAGKRRSPRDQPSEMAPLQRRSPRPVSTVKEFGVATVLRRLSLRKVSSK